MARFQFDTNIIETLAQQYDSSEGAISKLVANAWDADATHVQITLPEPLTDDPIVVMDDGYGMSPGEVRRYYFRVGYDRHRERGDTTPRGRHVRGMRGIGKFAGLQVAETMTVSTVFEGTETHYLLNRDYLRQLANSLESADVPLEVTTTAKSAGTTIELANLRHGFSFPDPNKVAQVLLRQFGRRDDFTITVNRDPIDLNVLQGTHDEVTLKLNSGNTVSGTIRITDKSGAVADPGILVRVNGRAIGPPTFFGLEKETEIPKSLLRRLVGEVNADHLVNDTLANWSGFVETAPATRNWLTRSCHNSDRVS